MPCERWISVNSGAWLWRFEDLTGVEKSCVAKAKNTKKSIGKMLYHCKLICVSPKHGMHRSLRRLKILYIHNCWNLFFVSESLWNSDKQKIIKLQNKPFYGSVISPFAVQLFLLPFSSHCSMQNIGFRDSGYVIKPPQPSSTFYKAPKSVEKNLETRATITTVPKQKSPS